jgi:hypothetical protein
MVIWKQTTMLFPQNKLSLYYSRYKTKDFADTYFLEEFITSVPARKMKLTTLTHGKVNGASL